MWMRRDLLPSVDQRYYASNTLAILFILLPLSLPPPPSPSLSLSKMFNSILVTQAQSGGQGSGKSEDTLNEIATDILSKVNCTVVHRTSSLEEELLMHRPTTQRVLLTPKVDWKL